MKTPPGIAFGELEIATGGNLVRLRGTDGKGHSSIGGKRGKIHAFSDAARRRMLQRLNSIDRARVPYMPRFITLTYPASWNPDPASWKADLRAFFKRMEREFGAFPIVWRLEPQERGAPHFHLLALTPRYIPHQWVAENWNAIVAPGDSDHLRACSEVRAAKTWRGVVSYVAKYMAKPQGADTLPDGIGKLWGVWKKALLPITIISYTMTPRQFWRVRRAILHCLKQHGVTLRVRGTMKGCSMYMSEREAKRLLALLL